MTSLLYTCPNTRRRAPSGIELDVPSLRASWSKTINIDCSLCGLVHELEVRDIYCDSVLQDASDVFGPSWRS